MCLPGNKLLLVILLLPAGAVANVSTTVTQDTNVVPGIPGATDSPAIIAPQREVIEPFDSKFAGIGRELLSPLAPSTNSFFSALTAGQPPYAKPLPAVPGTLYMVLTGCLCVSLVRDRRVWLAALAGLLWVGQTGIQAVPQLALRLSHRNHTEQQFTKELTYPYYLENSRLRSDIEGTQYIGLLRHLAGIPHRTMSFLQPRLSSLPKQESRKLTTPPCCRLNLSKNTNSFLFSSVIISERYSLNSLLNCLTLRVGQFICFSPAFIFENLPRGPPKLA